MTVSSEWARIVRWCNTHAPLTANRILPADPEKTMAVKARLGRDWGPELDEWFTLHGGALPMDVLVPPNYSLVTPDQVVSSNQEISAIWAESRSDEDGSLWIGEEAGEPAGTFLPHYITFAHYFTGHNLIVDTRPGEHQWCIMEFAADDADDGEFFGIHSANFLLQRRRASSTAPR